MENNNSKTYDVFDIAEKLIYRSMYDEASGGERITPLRLQKLLYYEQGYHLAVFDKPLFNKEIEAWVYGPVVPCIYEKYKHYGCSAIDEVQTAISMTDEEETLFNEVYEAYLDVSTIGLVNRTHSELPWKTTYKPNRHNVIPKETIKQYFKTQLV